MTKYRPNNCRDCGMSGNDGHISQRGLCERCGMLRWAKATQQVSLKQGPAFEAWQRGMLASGGYEGRPTTPFAPDA